MVDGKTYDYIIVGGGTAGCALASRLSEDPGVSVLVLEKGAVKNSLLSRSPLLSQNFHFGDKLQVVSDRFSEPSPEANGDKFQLWTAESLGGASRINAMVMTRGPPADYNAWAQDMSLDDWAWERAAQAVGLSIIDDVNDPAAPAMGFYRLDQAVDERAERNTAYQAYLNESIARKRQSHLTVCTGASALRLKMDEDAGSVRGVFVQPTAAGKSTSDVYVEARREVIVCCGALKTAQLLMLSGIGPRDQLDANGIHVFRDLPVGRFLSDHFAFPIALELPRRETMHMFETAIYGLWHALLWFLFRTGIMGSNCIPNTIFVRSGAIDDKTMAIVEQDPESEGDGHSGNNMDISQPRNTPDIEVMMFADWPVARKAIRFSMRLAQEFQRSGYPHPAPIAFAPGNELEKLAEWEATAEQLQSVAATPVKASQESAASTSSTPAKTWDTVTDDEIDRYIRSVAGVSLHPSCTCRMSNDPQSGVVDQRLRVHGVRNLRIADTSVFPRGVMPACHAYHVPKNVQPLIDYITPGIKLLAPTDELTEQGRQLLEKRGSSKPAPKPATKWHPSPPGYSLSAHGAQNQSDLSTCDIAITPACVAALYQIPPAPKHVDPNNTMGIFEAELQYWDQLDLDLFFTNFTHWIPNGGESMLDLELAYPIVYPQTITVWNVDDIHYQTWENDTYTWGFNTLLDAIDGSYCTYSAYGETGDLANWDPTYPDPGPDGYNGTLQCGVFKPTNVFSVSYGGQEADVPIAYQKRQCNEYLKLGLQGVSFLFASGDSGVGNYPEPYGDDGPTGCLGPEYNIFNPTWPNNCPYITNVGATKVYPGKTVFEPESAVYDPAGYPYSVNYSSGGGFSNVYPIPDYQKSAVATYFADHDPGYPYYSALAQLDPSDVYALPNVTLLAGNTGGIYNRIGRGIPDVAANGDNIAVYVGGEFGLSGGTSASTPIFSGVINRINEERIAVGKGPLGFLNPALYAHPEILNDITNGTNPACDEGGFYAVKGWDPVTGLGTPNFPKMLAFFMGLP
ncbi:hypothetical protein SLS64_005920 [Diaporthe eres]